MDIICIKDDFPQEYLDIYKKYGVSTPIKDSFYTIRQVTKHTTGEVGILLEELHNPKIPFKHPVLGESFMEPTWNIKRFAHLDGTPILEKELKEFISNTITLENLN